jgi:hypothetical protein
MIRNDTTSFVNKKYIVNDKRYIGVLANLRIVDREITDKKKSIKKNKKSYSVPGGDIY